MPRAPQPPVPEDFTSPLHDRTVVARLGLWLGSAFTLCFVTGLISHLHQHPVAWLPAPTGPAWGYRVTQGLHVASGTASVPLLLAKLYAAYPRLFTRPVVGSPVVMMERASIAVLVGSSLLMVSSGIANVAGWYVFGFGFTKVHYAFAWVAIGALVVHVAVKLPAIRDALSPAGAAVAGQQGRRTFVAGAVGVAAGAVVLTVGSAVPPLEPVSVLRSRRPGSSPLGVPVNRTATQARIDEKLDPGTGDDDWTLSVRGPTGRQTVTAAQLRALRQRTVSLPIACVEGWSAEATWEGVRVRDVLELVGGVGGDVRIVSAEQRGAYAQSVLPRAYADHPSTLLALRLNGSRLTRDHGFPVRLIAPNRPGVLQTKWVTGLEVLT
jgi:DMSO/TMAO reductase YedYZ molybdopterin-dependent catalytic subunit